MADITDIKSIVYTESPSACRKTASSSFRPAKVSKNQLKDVREYFGSFARQLARVNGKVALQRREGKRADSKKFT